MNWLTVASLCLALLADGKGATEYLEVTLKLPRTLQRDETALLTVRLGKLPRGRELEITTPAGRNLGVVSPFSIPSGQEAGTYTLPLPADAFVDGRVTVRLYLCLADKQKRKPTQDEVKSLRLAIGPAAPGN